VGVPTGGQRASHTLVGQSPYRPDVSAVFGAPDLAHGLHLSHGRPAHCDGGKQSWRHNPLQRAWTRGRDTPLWHTPCAGACIAVGFGAHWFEHQSADRCRLRGSRQAAGGCGRPPPAPAGRPAGRPAARRRAGGGRRRPAGGQQYWTERKPKVSYVRLNARDQKCTKCTGLL
jgi:hypothetical protein